MKRFAALILAIVLVCGVVPVAFASGNGAEDAADRLYQLGLLLGSGTDADGNPDFDLEKSLTREQAIIMLVRLLGKEEEALKGGWEMPFTDVSSWAKDYVGYAYEHGLTSGTGPTTFRGKDPVTAAQYITFVLRALGYSSESDFVWKTPWTLSDVIGLTEGQYTAENNADFIRSDMVIISASALDVEMKNSAVTLLESIGAAAPNVSYTKEDYLDRVLTDAQLAALMDANLNTLQAEISTIGDAVAYLDQFSPQNFSGFSGEIRLDIDYVFDLHTALMVTTPQTYAAFAAWCITDDYEGIKYVISTGMNTGALRILPMLALPVEGGYYVYSAHKNSTVLAREYNYSVDTKVSDLSDLEEDLKAPWSEPVHLQIFVADAEQRTLTFEVDENARWVEPRQGSAELVYVMSDEEKSAQEEKEKQQLIETGWANLQNNWDGFGFPASFEPTLTKTEVETLVGKDIDTVATTLKTLGDVLYYLALSGFYTTDGDIKVWEDGLCWSFNEAPETVFANNAGNCGGTAAFVPFLLAGDYDETGCLSMTSDVEIGGGHVITYIQDGSSCYVFDSRALVDTNYSWNGGLAKGADIVEAGRKWRDTIDPGYKLIFAYPTAEGDFPGMGDGKTVYLPEQYRDRITIVYEATSEGYGFEWRAIGDEAMSTISAIRKPVSTGPDDDVEINADGDYLTRVLTDQQLAELKYADAETLQAWISTVADAVAYLDQFECGFWDFIQGPGFVIDIDKLLNLHRSEATGCDVYTAITGWCLADDYPETQYLVAAASNSKGAATHHGLLLPTETGYCVISPAAYSARWNCVFGFDDAEVEALEGIEKKLAPLHAGMADDSELFLYHLFAAGAGEKTLNFSLDGTFLRTSDIAKELYRLSDEAISEMKAAEKAEWDAVAKNMQVSDYGMPAAIGNTTLSYADAYVLVGQEPETIRAKVNTVGDVLQYMIAARFGYDVPGAYTPWYGFWGFDAPGNVQLEQNYGCCCGGFANTVSYLLKGDYEKVGTLRWLGGGNHTISWVRTGGKYYVFDFTQYCAGGYYNNYWAPVTVLDDLADYYENMPDCYPKNEVVILVAFEAGDAMYPSSWTDPADFKGMTFPAEAEGNILIVYQKYADYGVEYADITTEIPGWID